MQIHYDVAILGGALTGSSTAYHLLSGDAAGGRGLHRRGRLRWPHRQPELDGALPHHPWPARPVGRRARLQPPDKDRRRRWIGHPVVGGGGLRPGRGLRSDRQRQPGVSRVGLVRTTGKALLAQAGLGRRGDGTGGGYVRARGRGAGAQARHDVRSAGDTPVRALPRLRFPRGDPGGGAWLASRRRCSRPRSRRSGRAPKTSSSKVDPRARSSAPSATPSTAWPWCSAPTSAARAAGRSRATPSAGWITRSGAARRWARSTPGCAAHSSPSQRIAASSRSPTTCLGRRGGGHPRPATAQLRRAGTARRLSFRASASGLGTSLDCGVRQV